MADLQPYRRRDFAGALAANAAAKPFNIALLVVTMAAARRRRRRDRARARSWRCSSTRPPACARSSTRRRPTRCSRACARERRERLDVRRRRGCGSTSSRRRSASTCAPRAGARRRSATRSSAPSCPTTRSRPRSTASCARWSAPPRARRRSTRRSPTTRPSRSRRGCAQVRAEPGREALVEALEHQARVQRRMEAQLGRFYDEMERMTVELDTIRGSLLSLSAERGRRAQTRLAGDVRSLRERMGAVADGMAEAYERRLGARLGQQPERERGEADHHAEHPVLRAHGQPRRRRRARARGRGRASAPRRGRATTNATCTYQAPFWLSSE